MIDYIEQAERVLEYYIDMKLAVENMDSSLQKLRKREAVNEKPLADVFKQEKQIVSNYLINYHEIKKQYEQDRERILDNSPPPSDGMPRGSNVGNRTASAGIALASMAVTGTWLKVIEELVAGLSDDGLLLLELKRTHEKHVSGKSKKIIAGELGVNVKTVYNRWQGILEKGQQMAVRRGLLR